MTTQTEKIYQAALLADAAYVTFNEPNYVVGDLEWQNPGLVSRLREEAFDGTSSPDDIPFGENGGGRGWTPDQFASFADRYRVVYHQPDQDNGFSATLFYDSVQDRHTVAFRGTNDIPFPDVSPTDLLLALGISSAVEGQQRSAIADFFEAAGLIDGAGAVNPPFAGSVDFVGHSLGGYLSLWAMYEFRELFDEVYTYNGAGISALPFSPDYRYIQDLVADNPLGADEQSRIHNFFAEEGIEVTANDLSFFRPGQREGLFIERRDLLGSVAFHSVSLLVQSLSVYRLFALIDENLALDAGTEALYAISNESVGSLDKAVAALSGLVGAGYTFTSVDEAGQFHQNLTLALGERSSLGGSIESLTGSNPDTILATAQADSAAGRGYRYALAALLPFAVTGGHEGTAIEQASYDLDNFSDEYLRDRTLMLSTLMRMNTEDQRHGDLSTHSYFADLEQGLAFNSDAISYGDGTVSDLRARLVFGSAADDAAAIEASSQDDRLYGLAGNDVIDGLDGSDYIEGGDGQDHLNGGNHADVLAGGAGNDTLRGGAGDDYLSGGAGGDVFAWQAGDGEDMIGDYDDGGDRLVVNGTDLATLQFARVMPNSPYYRDLDHPDITLRYDGAGLLIGIGSGPDQGAIKALHYSPAQGADYGIVLSDYPMDAAPVTDVVVTRLGSGQDETDPSAYWRQQSSQGGLDWSAITLLFEAASVANYSGGSLHGTLGGAFEGGPLADYLIGDNDANALHGLAGVDHLEGGGGDDFLEGGSGSDMLWGGEGDDILFGASRSALFAGEAPLGAQDEFYALQATDSALDSNLLAGGAGNDYIGGGQSTDYIDGGAGLSYLLGGPGGDHISGGPDRDVIFGDASLNYRYIELDNGQLGEQLEIAVTGYDAGAGSYDDAILAGAGNDLVRGELGDDELHGQAGDDELLGGDGNDSYFFTAGDGLDYVEDEQGVHTLVFTGIDPGELQILFQADQVLVGTGYGAQGFYFAGDQWDNMRLALESPAALIDRSLIDSHYFDAAGNLLLSVAGSATLTELQRDSLFQVDATDAQRPRIILGESVDTVEIEALAGGSAGAVMQIRGGVLQQSVELAAAQLATGLDFLELVDGVTMSLVGFAGSTFGSSGADLIIGSEAADEIHAGDGDDTIEGRGGDDDLFGDRGRDTLRGGPGQDMLAGGEGPDTYQFRPGDGQDLLQDTGGYHYFAFEGAIDASSIALYYTGNGDTRFRLEYGSGDAVSSEGASRSHWINGLSLNGVAIPLVQRSDLADGSFHDTRWNDVFEGGAGSDTIFLSGWGEDVLRFAAGDGADTINEQEAYYPTRMGEISFAPGVDVDALSFSFANGSAVIGYGAGDEITLASATVASFRDNALSRFTLVSGADPAWIPVIRAESYVGNFHGSFGADHIIGSAHVETIMPGYGDDIIEAGGGPDRIVLNDVYMHQGTAGIGHKAIRGEAGNDTVHAPLYQGLTFHYRPGDGHDTIEYDWSYSRAHPYRFSPDYQQNKVVFNPHGQDSLVFGEGIALADLRFMRIDDALQVSLRDCSGSVRIAEFFHAWEGESLPWSGDITEVWGIEGVGPSTLLHPALLDVLPRSPIAFLKFADGSSYELATVLSALLEVSPTTLVGTEGDDYLEGTASDDLIDGLGGDDYIVDTGGSNVIDAGAGNDDIELEGENTLEAGPGDDFVEIGGGRTVIRFGPGSGHDVAIMQLETSAIVVAMADGLAAGDLSIALTDTDWGPSPLLSLPATGDTLVLVGLRYDPVLGEEIADFENSVIEVRFADGTVLAGGELLTLGQGISGETEVGERRRETLIGSDGDDILVGGFGKDALSGGLGNDTYVFAAGDGRDEIRNADPDPLSVDSLRFNDIDHEQLWLARQGNHLVLNVAGSTDQVRIKRWYADEAEQLDAIYAGDRVLLRDQVEQLVNAMAVFDVPEGTGSVITEATRMELEPTLTSVWQMTG